MSNKSFFKSYVIERSLRGASLITVALALVSCSETGFRPVATVQNQSRPGTYSIPPKVDLLMIIDDTGSIYMPYSSIEKQVPKFLENLEAQKWDYHFATIPLTTFRRLSQVMTSKFDPNWAGSWTPPYPGAEMKDVFSVNSSVFTKSSNYTDFIDKEDVSSSLNGFEPGFQNIRNVLLNGISNTGFLRNDALFAMVLIGNGDDTSGVNYCDRAADGFKVACEFENVPVCVPTAADPIRGGSSSCKSAKTSFDYYKSEFQSLSQNLRFYAVVAKTSADRNNCLGGRADVGTRYKDMASALNGKSYNLCSQSIGSVLADLTSELQSERHAYHTQYLVIGREPVESSIKITKYVNGRDAVEIPQAEINGWTYEKYRDDVFAIYTMTPTGRKVEMNRVSGYVIHLNGTAELMGEDTAEIEFTAADIKASGGS